MWNVLGVLFLGLSLVLKVGKVTDISASLSSLL